MLDAVVVGSGFGGAVTAFRLAEQRWKVLVLERGRPWPPGSFPRTPRDFRGAFWDPPTGRHGLYDLWSFTGLNVVTASGLGGGSLIYANVMLRKPDFAGWPVTRTELDPHYDRVEAMQAPERYPEGLRGAGKAAALAHAGRAMDLPVEHPPLAVRFGSQPREPLPGATLHGVPRSSCRLCGECVVGCNDGAKQTLDLTYLSRARELGAEIRTLCEARTLEPLPGGGWAVGYRQHLEGREGVAPGLLDAAQEPKVRVEARHVVLAAGTVGTVRLLLRNRVALPRLSRAVGHGVSGNGDLLGFVRNTRDGDGWRYLDPSRGPTITTSVHVPAKRSRSGREHYVQDGGAPAFTEWLWQLGELPEDAWRARRTLARRVREKLRGERDANLSAELAELLGSGRMSAAMMPVLGMGMDVADGRLALNAEGQLDLTTPEPVGEQPHYAALEATGKALARQMGGEWSVPPAAHTTTVHPVGGCAMGAVVDAFGNVGGYPGLHVADGSVMPGAVGPNPSLTIAALADRFAEAMLA